MLEQESCLSPQILLPYSFSLTSATSNNTAEYESLIIGLELAFDMRIDPLIVYGDSQLIIRKQRKDERLARTDLGSASTSHEVIAPQRDLRRKTYHMCNENGHDTASC